MSDIKNKYKEINPEGHWFDKSTMEFFKSKLPEYGFLHKERLFFISSESAPESIRKYTVRELGKNGNINTIGYFNSHTSSRTAKKELKDYLGLK